MQLLQVGGIWMVAILACGAAAVGIFLERLFHLHRAHINAEDFMKGIRNLLKRQNPKEAMTICDETPGPLAHIIRAALRAFGGSRDEIRSAIEEAGKGEVPRLERNLPMLATLAQVSPLLGLLGTVMGFIRVFHELAQKPVVQLHELSHGVMQAMACTAAGLAVAIFCYLAHNYLAARVQSIVTDMEKYSAEILSLLTAREEKQNEVTVS